jgi:hypothetical protein
VQLVIFNLYLILHIYIQIFDVTRLRRIIMFIILVFAALHTTSMHVLQ